MIFSLNAWVLGIFIWKLENHLHGSSLICQSPTKAIWLVIMKTLQSYVACYCIELCQIVVTLVIILFILTWARFMCTTISPCYASTLEVSIVPCINIHTRAHLDPIVWILFLCESSFWLCNRCDASMLYLLSYTLSSTYSQSWTHQEKKHNSSQSEESTRIEGPTREGKPP
jgi:hypothetical protein